MEINFPPKATYESTLADIMRQSDDMRERREARDALCISLAREDSLEGFRHYCLFVHDWVLPPHLLEWAGLLCSGERIGIVGPPDSGKTRLIRAWCEWKIGLRRDRAIMVIGNTIKQAKKVVWAVGRVISDSTKYRQVFPDCKPTDQWAMDSITVERHGLPMEFRIEATLSGFGIDGAYQGQHPDDMVIDDPTDQNDVNSPPTMHMQREQVTGVLYDRLKDGGNLFAIFTRWADDDLAPTLEQIGIDIKSYPAYKDKETPYPWDTGPFTPDHPVSLLCAAWANWQQLEEKRRAKADDLFKLTFLNQTEGAVRGERVFPALSKALHYVSMAGRGRGFTKVTSTRLGGDWGTTVQHKSAMVVVTKNVRQEVWVRAAWMSPRGSTVEMGEKVYDWKTQFNLTMAHYDRSQGALHDFFEQCGLNAFKGENGVEARIGALRTLLEHDLFFVDSDGENTQLVWSQIASYRYDEVGRVIEVQDDLVDALLYAIFAILEASKVGPGPNIEIVDPKQGGRFAQFDPEHDDFNPVKEAASIGHGTKQKPRGGGFHSDMRTYGRGI